MDNREYGLTKSAETTESWEAWLEDFKNFYYEPLFQKYGFTFAEAAALWQENTLKNRIEELVEQLRGGDSAS